MSNVEKGMIIAVFVIFGAISTPCPVLSAAPDQQSRTFYTDIISAALLRTSYVPAGLRPLPN